MNRLFIPALSALLVLFNVIPAGSQNRIGKYGFPIYEDYTVPVPDKPLDITRDDLQLTDKYLPLYPEGITYADAEGLRRLYNYYRDDPQGQKEWKAMQDKALKCIPTWDISKCLGERKRYMYAFLELKPFAELYIFTGNELVSDFIRCHLAKAADLPLDFWTHGELRKVNPEKPKGYLESSHISRMLGTVITAVRRNMSEEEIEKIEKAWYERAYVPMLNFLEEPMLNNFTAVISCGVLYASKYFGEKDAWDRGVWGLRYYVSHTIEKDGSDAEGYGYYAYPAGLLLQAALVMDEDEMRQVFDGADIDKTMEWRLYGQMFDEDGTGMTKRITYSDNTYGGIIRGGSDIPCALSRYIYKDPLAAWIAKTYNARMNKLELLLDAKFPGLDVKPVSPSEAGLPLIRSFMSGDCYIRSDWEPEGLLLGLKSGDCAARIGHAHNRPELNSLTLGGYGEYFIVTCGSASYRSPIHTTYDRSTRAANTITIDGANQKYPGEAKVTRAEQLPDGTYFLRSDIVDAYNVKTLEGCFRSVHYIPEGGFFIVRDFLGTQDGLDHAYDYRFHIFNRDGATEISGKSDFLKVARPKADLYIAMNRKMDLSQNEGYMHGPGSRDYDPDGPNQGKPGSSVELDWNFSGPALDVCAVLFPSRKGAKAPKVSFGKDYVKVNGKKYAFMDQVPEIPVNTPERTAKEFTLVFDNAATFVSDDGKKPFGSRVNGQRTSAAAFANANHGVFWSSAPGMEKYRFEAETACNWDSHLCFPANTPVKLPSVKGYRLSAVDIFSVKNSGDKKFSVTGAGDFVLNKAGESNSSHVFTIKDKSLKEYSVSCTSDTAIKFSLVYEKK